MLNRRPKAAKKLVTEASQTFTFHRRAFFLGGAQLAVGGLLIGRMGWIAIAENEKYRLLSESNRVNFTLIPPRRGWIVDRVGKPLASNRTDFRVDIIPDRLQDRARVITELTTLLQLDPNDVDRINEDLDKAAGFQPVQVADDLTYEQFAAVSIRLADLPGVAPDQGFSRFYPAGPSVGHLIGYVGAASAEEYQKSKNMLFITPGYKMGKQGLEKSLDTTLTGKPGARRVEVTAHGRIVRELTTRPDVPAARSASPSTRASRNLPGGGWARRAARWSSSTAPMATCWPRPRCPASIPTASRTASPISNMRC